MNKNFVIAFIFCFVILVPTLVWAQEFKPLVGIPQLNPAKPDVNGYLNTAYILSISLAAFLAVGRIIIAGVKYMLTDVVVTKGEARKEIQGALLGLLIVLGAIVILDTINPNLKKINFLKNANGITVKIDEENRSRAPSLSPGDSVEIPEDFEDQAALEEYCRSHGGTPVMVGENIRCTPTSVANATNSLAVNTPTEFCANTGSRNFYALEDHCESLGGEAVTVGEAVNYIGETLVCRTYSCVRDDEIEGGEESDEDDIAERLRKAQCESEGKVFTQATLFDSEKCEISTSVDPVYGEGGEESDEDDIAERLRKAQCESEGKTFYSGRCINPVTPAVINVAEDVSVGAAIPSVDLAANHTETFTYTKNDMINDASNGTSFQDRLKQRQRELNETVCEGRGTVTSKPPITGFGSVEIFCKS